MDSKYLPFYTSLSKDCKSIINIIERRSSKILSASSHNAPIYFYDLMRTYLKEVNKIGDINYNIKQRKLNLFEMNCETKDFLYISKFEIKSSSVFFVEESLVNMGDGEVVFNRKMYNKNYF